MLHDLIAGDSVLMAFWQGHLRTVESEAHQQEEQTMRMQLGTFLTTTMFLGAIGLATGAWALNATDRQTPFHNEGKSDGQRDFGYSLAANATQLTLATQRMSLAGQNRKSSVGPGMSVVGGKADFDFGRLDFRF